MEALSVMNAGVYEDIYKIHASSIGLGSIYKPTLVVFSAIPGSGKSELTKRLVANHGFTRLANKDIREAIKQAGHMDDVVIGDYTLWILDKLTQQGSKSIVFDRNIDQCYELIKKWAHNNNYKFVVVQIEVGRENIEKRLHKREGDKVSYVLSVLDYYQNQHRQITQTIQADIVLNEDYNLDDAARLIAETALASKVT